jgi:uncharacterized protein
VTTLRMSIVILLAIAAAGCTSPMSSFYTLDAVAVPEGTPAARLTVAVGPVTIPAGIDRPEFVVQTAPNRVELDEFHRWAAPLGETIASVVAQDLGVLLGTPHVVVGVFPGVDSAFRVRIDVQRFESALGKDVLVDAAWVVYGVSGRQPRAGRTTVREPLSGKDFDGIAAAHSRALATLSADIAKAIRDDSSRRR